MEAPPTVDALDVRERQRPGPPLALLAPEARAAFFEALNDGAPISHACEIAGVHRSTYYNLVHRAEGDASEAEEARAFVADVARVRAEVSRRRMRLIEAHGAKDWRALAWLQERGHPDEFGQRAQVEHTGSVGVRHEVLALAAELGTMSVEQLKALALTDGEG